MLVSQLLTYAKDDQDHPSWREDRRKFSATLPALRSIRLLNRHPLPNTDLCLLGRRLILRWAMGTPSDPQTLFRTRTSPPACACRGREAKLYF